MHFSIAQCALVNDLCSKCCLLAVRHPQDIYVNVRITLDITADGANSPVHLHNAADGKSLA